MRTIEKAYATVAEGQIHLRQCPVGAAMGGEGAGLPLILLHASPACSKSLTPILGSVSENRRCIAFDTPCNGRSCAPGMSDPEISDFADMLDRACDGMGLDRVALYGTHTGAHIAIAWALARPDRVRALVLDGVALLDPDQRSEMLELYAQPRVPDEYGSQFAWAWQYLRDQMIFFPHYRKDAEHVRRGGTFDAALLHDLTLGVLNNLETYHMPYHAVFRHDVRADLTQIRCPTLVIAAGEGALDNAVEEVGRLIASAKVQFASADPAAKARLIESFLEELKL